jgi:tetratricopeptide (TPR) repeat protein
MNRLRKPLEFVSRTVALIQSIGESLFSRGLWPIGFAVTLGALALPWFDPILSPRFTALNFPVLGAVGEWPRLLSLTGYAIPASGLILIAAIAWLFRWSIVTTAAGCFLLLLGITFYLQIACWQPAWLQLAIDNGNDYQRAYNFEITYNLPNTTSQSPAAGLTEPITSFSNRLMVADAAIDVGWRIFMAGAGWILISGLCLFRSLTRCLMTCAVLGCVAVLVVALQLRPTVAATFSLSDAQRAAAGGDRRAEEALLRRALQQDKFLRLQPDLYLKLGAIKELQDDHRAAEYHLHRAATLARVQRIDEAIEEYRAAIAAAEGPLKLVAKRALNDLAILHGDSFYPQGALATAKQYWMIALEEKPEQLAAYYRIGHALRDLADYTGAIPYFEKTLDLTSQDVLRSSSKLDIGDCYFRLGDIEKARAFYIASQEPNVTVNSRSFKTLTESYYR